MCLFNIKKKSNFILRFFYIIFYLVVFVTADGFIQLLFGQNILGFELIRDDRVTGLFKDESILGSYLSKIIVLIVSLYFSN